MEEKKIINSAGVDIELCDGTHTIKSNSVEAEAINIKLIKEQSCPKVLVGETLKYTVKIINECGSEVHDLIFKDTFDNCTKYVEGSFTVDPEKARVIWDEFQSIILEQLPVIYLIRQRSFFAIQNRWDFTNFYFDNLNGAETSYLFLRAQ